MASKIHQSETETNNQKQVTALYEAINAKDVRTVKRLLAPDLEWWFHGPPSQQHLMRFLTGRLDSTDQNNCSSFVFKPLSVVAFGSLVLVEGFQEKNSVTWVHAWSGIITQVREYFNTFVSVTRLGRSNHLDDDHTKTTTTGGIGQNQQVLSEYLAE